MKRIISAIFCVAMCFIGTVVLADDDYVAAKYDYTDKTIEIIGNIGQEAGVPVTACITVSFLPVLSDDNPPVAAYLLFTGTNGKISDERKFDGVLSSGLCTVWLTSANGHKESDFIIFDLDDQGTKDVLVKINSETDAEKLSKYLGDENKNIEKIGYIYSLTEKYIESIAEFCIAYKKAEGKPFGFNELLRAVDYVLFNSKFKDGFSLDECMAAYCGSLQCTYSDYTALSGEMKNEIGKLVKSANFIKNGKLITFNEMVLICRARLATSSWASLRDVLSVAAVDYGIDMSTNSVYASIYRSSSQQVFYNMLGTVQEAKSLTEIADAFNNECNIVKKELEAGARQSSSSSPRSSGVISTLPSVKNLNELPIYNYEPAKKSMNLLDMDNHFSKDAVKYLTEKGAISGYEDNTFRPDGNVTRAEMAAMIYGVIGGDRAEAYFSDVASDAWFAEGIYSLAAKGIIFGSNGAFAPNEYVTRQDAVVVLKRVADLKGISLKADSEKFIDIELISDYAIDAVSALSAAEIIKGFNGYFRPQDTCTRGEMAVMLYRLLTVQEGVK